MRPFRWFRHLQCAAVAAFLVTSLPSFAQLAADPAAQPSPSRFTSVPAKMSSRRAGHTATLLDDGTVLIAGGFSSATLPARALATAELYDPIVGTFTALASRMQSRRTGHAASKLADGRVLITGGQTTDNDANGSDTAEIYDPATKAFASIPAHMTSPRGGHISALLPNGRVLIAGGYDDQCTGLDSAETFNPATQKFSLLEAHLVAGRSELAGASYDNGWVLLTGGGSCDSTYDTAEAYDLLQHVFTPLASTMTVLREGHASSRLSDGGILITGGGTMGSDPPSTLVVLNTAEVLNPRTSKFHRITPKMRSARGFHTQTTLADGSVLVTGGAKLGSGGGLVVLNTAETFTP